MTDALSPDMEAVADGAVGARLGLADGDIDAGVEVARRHASRGDMAEALKMYAMLVACAPRRHDLVLGLGACALQFGEHELALKAADAATVIAPRDPRNALLAGRAGRSMGLRAEAREDLELAVELGLGVGDAATVLDARRLLAAMGS